MVALRIQKSVLKSHYCFEKRSKKHYNVALKDLRKLSNPSDYTEKLFMKFGFIRSCIFLFPQFSRHNTLQKVNKLSAVSILFIL